MKNSVKIIPKLDWQLGRSCSSDRQSMPCLGEFREIRPNIGEKLYQGDYGQFTQMSDILNPAPSPNPHPPHEADLEQIFNFVCNKANNGQMVIFLAIWSKFWIRYIIYIMYFIYNTEIVIH